MCGAGDYENAAWPANTLSMTTATGSCLPGWSGSPTRYCEAEGSWSSTVSNPCIQLFCPAGALDNAAWPLSAAGSTDVSGVCAEGYSGTGVRDCDINGNWATVKTPCTRNVCTAVTESNVNWPLTNSLTTISGVCAAGFSGSPSRTCLADGTFGEIINPCVQILCQERSEGNALWVSSAAGTETVAGTCNLGWDGSPIRACNIVGEWQTISNPCIQIKCPALNDSSALALFPEANAGDSAVSGACYDNTSGFPARDCFYNGTWSEVSNPCSTNPCPALRNNGHADWDSPDAVDQLVNGTCVAGYDTTLPRPQRMCNGDGRWSSTITNPCQPIYCTASTPGYSPFNAEWPAQVQAGSSTSGTCLPGYSGTTARTCTITGVWGTPSPLCQAIKCAAISNDGAQSSWSETQAGQTATGVCFAGYEGSPTRECSLTGQWGPVSSPCEVKKCPAGNANSASWPVTEAGATATGACLTGFTGTVTRVCGPDAVWGTVIGTCTQVSCAAETSGNTNWPSTLAGSIATGTCTIGFGGTPLRQCLSNGVWDTPTGACSRLKCLSTNSHNADWPTVDSLTYGVSGTCVAGWQGAPRRNCTELGQWSLSVNNQCSRITCPAFEDATGSWPLGYSSSEVTGTCPEGSFGSPVRSCLNSGAWSGIVSGFCTGTFVCFCVFSC